MIKGNMYPLNKVLKIGSEPGESHYLLLAEGDTGYEISFGRRRTMQVSSNSYIVTVSEDKYHLDKIAFDGGTCHYVRELKAKNIPHEIPAKLPESNSRIYSRLQCAVGDTWWSPRVRGFFGSNGYAITDVGYIGDDKYESYRINLCINPGAFRIGKNSITGITGHEIPNDAFIIKLLEETVAVEEGDPLLALFKDAGVWRNIEDIRFEAEDDE